jgi:shikimate kinase
MSATRTGITLIGMPGAGKSTVGVLLSKRMALDFVDSDLVIQVRQHKPLQRVLDDKGYLGLRAIEAEVLLSLDPGGCVIATGGSAVYSAEAMHHLGNHSRIVWLDVPLAELRRRIRDYDTRGIARRPEQSFEELFAERMALYARYAEVHIDCANLSHEDVLERVIAALDQPR